MKVTDKPMNATDKFAPRTATGWTSVALGFGLIVVGLLLFVVSNAVTNGGDESAPTWLRVLAPVAVLAVAIPAAVLGFRARRTDPSPLGTIALVIACVVGGWSAITGVAGLFV